MQSETKHKIMEICGGIASITIIIMLITASMHHAPTDRLKNAVHSFTAPAVGPNPPPTPPITRRGDKKVLVIPANQDPTNKNKHVIIPPSLRSPSSTAHRLASLKDVHKQHLLHHGLWLYVVNDKQEILLLRHSLYTNTCPDRWNVIERHITPLSRSTTSASVGLHDMFGWILDHRDILPLGEPTKLKMTHLNGEGENQITDHVFYFHHGHESGDELTKQLRQWKGEEEEEGEGEGEGEGERERENRQKDPLSLPHPSTQGTAQLNQYVQARFVPLDEVWSSIHDDKNHMMCSHKEIEDQLEIGLTRLCIELKKLPNTPSYCSSAGSTANDSGAEEPTSADAESDIFVYKPETIDMEKFKDELENGAKNTKKEDDEQAEESKELSDIVSAMTSEATSTLRNLRYVDSKVNKNLKSQSKLLADKLLKKMEGTVTDAEGTLANIASISNKLQSMHGGARHDMSDSLALHIEKTLRHVHNTVHKIKDVGDALSHHHDDAVRKIAESVQETMNETSEHAKRTLEHLKSFNEKLNMSRIDARKQLADNIESHIASSNLRAARHSDMLRSTIEKLAEQKEHHDNYLSEAIENHIGEMKSNATSILEGLTGKKDILGALTHLHEVHGLDFHEQPPTEKELGE